MLVPMSTRFFRAGVGTVIFNTHGEVALFRRLSKPAGVWQFQQGGINFDEQPQETLWRELKEETGLTNNDVAVIAKLPEWTLYEDFVESKNIVNNRIGQVHQWFFLKLTSGVEINLSHASENEFDNFRWVTFAEAVESCGEHKRHVYERLEKFFELEIKSTL